MKKPSQTRIFFRRHPQRSARSFSPSFWVEVGWGADIIPYPLKNALYKNKLKPQKQKKTVFVFPVLNLFFWLRTARQA